MGVCLSLWVYVCVCVSVCVSVWFVFLCGVCVFGCLGVLICFYLFLKFISIDVYL